MIRWAGNRSSIDDYDRPRGLFEPTDAQDDLQRRRRRLSLGGLGASMPNIFKSDEWAELRDTKSPDDGGAKAARARRRSMGVTTVYPAGNHPSSPLVPHAALARSPSFSIASESPDSLSQSGHRLPTHLRDKILRERRLERMGSSGSSDLYRGDEYLRAFPTVPTSSDMRRLELELSHRGRERRSSSRGPHERTRSLSPPASHSRNEFSGIKIYSDVRIPNSAVF